MSRPTAALWVLGLLCGATASAWAQTGDGYVGVYADSLGTIACSTVPQMTGTTLYVIGKAAGTTAGGITGAEFRIEVTSPTGWMFSYSPPESANVVNGAVMDTSADSLDSSGMNLAFPSCVYPLNGVIHLGTISVFNLNGSDTQLLVKRHNVPRNPSEPCALFVACDDPVFSKWCMSVSPESTCTLSKPLTRLHWDDEVISATTLNAGGPEQPVALGTMDQQILALFKPGAIALPPGLSAATLEATTITSDSLAELLSSSGVTAIAQAFPGEVPAEELKDVLRVVLPDVESRDALVATLQGDPEVIFAQKNGGAICHATREDSVESYVGRDLGLGTWTDQVTPRIASVCYWGPPTDQCYYTVQNCTNDPLVHWQWPLWNPGAPGISSATCFKDLKIDQAWSLTHGTSITIELLGNGIARNEDLAGRISGPEGDLGDTPYAGVLVANQDNGIGIAGLNWNARVKVSQVRSNSGNALDDVGIAFALKLAGRNRIILNEYRLADANGDQRNSPTVRVMLLNAYKNDKILINAMGDDIFDNNEREYPAGYDQGTITVGSMRPNGIRDSDSKTGNHIDFIAPGQQIRTTFGSGYSWRQGTGLAAAELAGIVSLMLGVDPGLYNDDVYEMLRMSANYNSSPARNSDVGWGCPNAWDAVRRLQSPYRIYHWTADGADWWNEREYDHGIWMTSPAPGWGAGQYWTQKYEVFKVVPYYYDFANQPQAWGLGSRTTGYPGGSEVDGNYYPIPNCELVEGREHEATLRTYVYRLTREFYWGETYGWFPCAPWEIHWEYAAWGELNPVDVEAGRTPGDRLMFSVESPMRGQVRMSVDLPSPMTVQLKVYNVSGSLVADVYSGALTAGRHDFEWQGGGRNSTPVRSGVYFAKLQANGVTASKKIVLVR
jgi:hypothetical protein